jgi:hypothetical protein
LVAGWPDFLAASVHVRVVGEMRLKVAAGAAVFEMLEGSIVAFDPLYSSGGPVGTADAEGAKAAAPAAEAAVDDHSTAAVEQAVEHDGVRRASWELGGQHKLAGFAYRCIHQGLEALGLLAAGAEERGSNLAVVHCFSKPDESLSAVAELTVDGGKGRRSRAGTRTVHV